MGALTFFLSHVVRSTGISASLAVLSDPADDRVVNNDSGDIACDHYTLYEEDVQIMKVCFFVRVRGVGCVYRCGPAISWPRERCTEVPKQMPP